MILSSLSTGQLRVAVVACFVARAIVRISGQYLAIAVKEKTEFAGIV